MNALPSTNQLSVLEKIALMEQLWEELSRNPANVPFPEWQKKDLAERIAAFDEGRIQAEDIEVVEKRLRDRFK
jgi:putative addiction module component (TIGR02574 family)